MCAWSTTTVDAEHDRGFVNNEKESCSDGGCGCGLIESGFRCPSSSLVVLELCHDFDKQTECDLALFVVYDSNE